MKLLPAAALFASLLASATVFAAPPAVPPERIPVLLELFTSEGCSSCPPADRILEKLDRQPVDRADLIVISEHVDYWNYLGWSDPYSSPLFSRRQKMYSDRLGASVYTPQLVVDGAFQLVGSDEQEALRAIAHAAEKAKIPLSIRAEPPAGNNTIHLETNSGAANADLYIVIAADRARSQVLRGENGGHLLTHVAVAQSIVKAGKWAAGATSRDVPLPSLPAGSQEGETRVIVFLQDPKTIRILGVAQIRI